MCRLDSNIEALYEKTIDAFVEQGRPFSGYDLTVETRRREGVQMRHGPNRQGIHEIPSLIELCDDFGDWDKTLTSLHNGTQVLVYHPNGYDLSQYEPMADSYSKGQSTSSPVAAQTSSPTVCTSAPAGISGSSPLGSDDDADDVGGEQDDGTYKTNCRGGLFVRTQFLREAEIEPNDTVNVVINDGEILLTNITSGLQGYLSIDQRKIERNGDLRLARRTLHEANMTGDSFNIENTDNGVKITEP